MRGADHLVPVSGVSGVPNGVLYIYGAGGYRYFLATGYLVYSHLIED